MIPHTYFEYEITKGQGGYVVNASRYEIKEDGSRGNYAYDKFYFSNAEDLINWLGDLSSLEVRS